MKAVTMIMTVLKRNNHETLFTPDRYDPALHQLGGGAYLRSVGIWFYDFEQDKYSIPVGLGIGQVIKKGNTVYNIFIEPQYSVADKGDGIAKWQIFVGFNMQFLGL